MRKLLALLSLLALPALADTINSSVVIKDVSNNKVTTTNVSGKQGLDVNVITAGGTSTVNQGTPASASNAWPMYLCNAGAVHCLAINVDGSINVAATISGPVTVANPATNYALETGGNLASILAKLNSSIAVTGTFFQATQPVSVASLPLPSNASQETGGHLASIDAKITNPLPVNVASLPLPANAAQETGGNLAGINGKLTTTANGLKVDGSAITQPVSATVLPLPTGAATSANQTNGTQLTGLVAGSAIIGKVGIDQTTPGTTNGVQVNAALPTGTNSIGQVTSNAGTNTSTASLALESGGHLASIDTKTPALGQALSAASVPVVLPASQVTTLTPPTTVTVQQPTGTNLHVVVDSAPSTAVTGTVAVSNFPASQTVAQATAASLNATVVGTGGAALASAANQTNGSQQTQIVQGGNTAVVSAAGALKVDGSAVTQPVSGTVTANAGTNLNTSLLQLDTTGAKLNNAQGSTTSGQSGPLIQGAVTTASPAYTTAQTSPLSLTPAGALRTDASATTQPVSGTVTANAGTNLNTSALALSANQTNGTQKGQVVDGANATVGPVSTISGTNYLPVIQASSGISGSAVPPRSSVVAGSDGTNARTLSTDTSGNLGVNAQTQAAASSATIGSVSLGNSTGKVVKMETGNISTTAVTANQTIVTYTVTAGKTFYLQYWDCSANTEAAAVTATAFGTCSLSINGTIVWTQYFHGSGTSGFDPIDVSEPIPVAAGQVILMETTPAAATAFFWYANFGGYEK